MKAALLVRCSTNKQDYDRQLKDLNKVAEKLNFEIDSKNIFGEYVTGKDDTTKVDRKSVRRLRETATDKKFDVILINEVNRLSRDSVSGRVYIRQFNSLDMPIYFRDKNKWTIDLNTRIIDTGFEKELGNFFDGAAEYLVSLKTQTASGRRKRLEDNQMTQGKPAYGYMKLGGKDKMIRSTIIIDPETNQTVIDTFNTYLEDGSTLKSTSLAITVKYNKQFSIGKINHILNYSGYYSGQTVVNIKDPDRKDLIEPFTLTFEPLIKEELFQQVREKLNGNRSYIKPYNNKQRIYLLSRIIKCSFCGHSFTPRKRTDNRSAHNWLCMSRINNSCKCNSHINLNEEKITPIIWDFIKKELILFTDINLDERNRRVEEENINIEKHKESIIDLTNNIDNQKAIQQKAYKAYLSSSKEVEEISLENYNTTLIETKKEVDYLTGRIVTIKKYIQESNDKILRYSQTDYTESYIKEVESDFNKKRELFIEYIKAVYPYKVDYRIVILEVHTVDGIYNILLDGNQRNNKEAYYIGSNFSTWQNSISKFPAYDTGDYFVISNANMVMDSNEMEEFVNYNQMVEICKSNDWIIKY